MAGETTPRGAAQMLRDLRFTEMMVSFVDEITPGVLAIVRGEAPVGKTGKFRKSIYPERRTRAGAVQLLMSSALKVTSKAGKEYALASLIIEGTKPHDIPGAFGIPPPFGIGGQFDGKFHPGTKPNPFPDRAWDQVETTVTSLFARKVTDRITEAMGGDDV